jgi:predicted Rossmann fold nucleotide-binding protein DprA/Smf involved in DNA uptake
MVSYDARQLLRWLRVARILEGGPKHIDDIAHALEEPMALVHGELLIMEVKGLIAQRRKNYWESLLPNEEGDEDANRDTDD